MLPADALELRSKILRANSPSGVDRALEHADHILRGSGVEAIEGDYYVGGYYGNTVLLYVNMGDTYQPTLYFNTVSGTFNVGSWGDWVEANQRRYRIR